MGAADDHAVLVAGRCVHEQRLRRGQRRDRVVERGRAQQLRALDAGDASS
ncbi:MAG: hypothetical protein KatS3mg010_1580 [Acidimicrobiia bacterium]|nr:MAG: hypothetical protein KatS3mg010_1580 [Acidimicrobiia bacterium]